MTNNPSSDRWTTANERFKARNSDCLSIGVIAAVALHAGLFALFPELRAADIRIGDNPVTVVEPPTVEIPPPPEDIVRPATPRASSDLIDDAFTIPKTDWDSNPPETLGPPPAGARPSDVPVWIARETEPVLKNREALAKLAEQRYPPILRDAGISATVAVYFFVSETGGVTNAVVQRSSGYPQFDRVALEVASQGAFVPARNRDRPVGVWILLPIEFKAR